MTHHTAHKHAHVLTHDEIAHLAYHLWLQEGKPLGRSQEHWQRAEETLRNGHGCASCRGEACQSKRRPASHAHASLPPFVESPMVPLSRARQPGVEVEQQVSAYANEPSLV